MTKSEMFKAAHKLAKAYKVQVGGDYMVCLSCSLKAVIKASKQGFKDADMFKAINAKISKVSKELALITHEVKNNLTHGLKEFAATYKLEAAKKQLDKGHFFGEVFTKNGMVCAWERSITFTQEAY